MAGRPSGGKAQEAFSESSVRQIEKGLSSKSSSTAFVREGSLGEGVDSTVKFAQKQSFRRLAFKSGLVILWDPVVSTGMDELATLLLLAYLKKPLTFPFPAIRHS